MVVVVEVVEVVVVVGGPLASGSSERPLGDALWAYWPTLATVAAESDSVPLEGLSAGRIPGHYGFRRILSRWLRYPSNSEQSGTNIAEPHLLTRGQQVIRLCSGYPGE